MFVFHIGPDHPLVLWAKTRLGRAVFATTFCVALTALAIWAVPVGVRQYLLSRGPGRVQGEVLETHTFGGNNGTEVNTAVRYRFTVSGREYGYRGPTGGAWCDVSREAMDAAADTGRIDVIYRPTDPWNNAPASKERWLTAWAAGLILLPGGLAALAWVWVGRVVQEEIRRRIGEPVTITTE